MTAGATVGPVRGRAREVGRILIVGGATAWQCQIKLSLSDLGFEVGVCSLESMRPSFELNAPDLVLVNATPIAEWAFSLCEWIRASGVVPIIVVAADGMDVVRCLTSGADLALNHPVGTKELVARVRSALRRSPPRIRESGLVGSFGSLKVDGVEQALYGNQGSVHLDHDAFAMMELLVLNGLRVTTRHALRTLLGVSDLELEGCIRRLRVKVESVDGWRRIVSVRGVGFRLLPDRPDASRHDELPADVGAAYPGTSRPWPSGQPRG